jgi:AcrR family transcriptional regulator
MDLRAERTRAALLGAFFGLVQERRYDEIKVADIVARAGVSRSAFYAHFAGKDALLATSIAGPFSMLAATLKGDNAAALVGLLDHFWTNRALARSIFQEPIRRRIVVVLTDQVERILDEGGPWKRGPLIMPSRLAAIQLAELLLAPVAAWLAGTSSCDSRTLATALGRVSGAALEAMSLPATAGRR